MYMQEFSRFYEYNNAIIKRISVKFLFFRLENNNKVLRQNMFVIIKRTFAKFLVF